MWLVPVAAIAGAFGATGAVLVLAQRGASTERLLLAGVALNALLGAGDEFRARALCRTLRTNTQIISGCWVDLEDRTWEHVLVAAMIFPAALLLWRARPAHGSAQSRRGGGAKSRRRRRSPTSRAARTRHDPCEPSRPPVAGTIGSRRPRGAAHAADARGTGASTTWSPLAIVGGAAFVLGCDLVSRTTDNLRLGVVTSLVGGPFFLWLLRRHR